MEHILKRYNIYFVILWILFFLHSYYYINDVINKTLFLNNFNNLFFDLFLRTLVSVFCLFLNIYPIVLFISCFFKKNITKISLILLPTLSIILCNPLVISFWEGNRNNYNIYLLKIILNSPNALYLLLLIPILIISLFLRKNNKFFNFSILITIIFLLGNIIYHFGTISFWSDYSKEKLLIQNRFLHSYNQFNSKDINKLCYINNFTCLQIKDKKIIANYDYLKPVQDKIYLFSKDIPMNEHRIISFENREARFRLNIFPYLGHFYIDSNNNGLVVLDNYYPRNTVVTGTILNFMLLCLYLFWIVLMSIILQFHEKRIYLKKVG